MTGRTAALYSPQPAAPHTKQTASRLARVLMSILAPALILACTIAALSDIGTASSTPAAVIVLDAEEQRFLDLINTYRAGLGLAALAPDPQLQAASRWMSEDMAANDYFSHYDSLGRDPFQRMDAFGYTYNVWKGENLAAGTAQAQVAFDLWKASPGHNSNMVNPQFHGIGIARAYGPTAGLGWYWTTDFGGVANPDPPADPTPSATPPRTPTPTATPTASPQPTPTASAQTTLTPIPTPTTTPTPEPTATDAPEAGVQGDLDCNAQIDAKDALAVLRIVAAVSAGTCGQVSPDVNCSGSTETTDALVILQYVADIPADAGNECPKVGTSLS